MSKHEQTWAGWVAGGGRRQTTDRRTDGQTDKQSQPCSENKPPANLKKGCLRQT